MVFACIIPFRIPHLWSVYGCDGGLCEDDYSITIFQNQPVVLIREGFLLAYSLLPSVGNVGHCMGGDAAKAATRSVRRELELTEMTSETSLLAAHLRPYSTASSSGILGPSRLLKNRVSGRWLSLKPSKRQMRSSPSPLSEFL